MTFAIIKSVDLINEGKHEEVQELVRKALLVKIDDSVGTDLFEDPLTRIQNTDLLVDERRIGIPAFDDYIGNIRRGEMGFIYAPSSGGKSVMLANIGYYLAKQTLDVYIISLELNETMYSKRLDSIVTDHSIKEHRGVADEIARDLEKLSGSFGKIVTKRMPYRTTPAQVRVCLMEYHLKYGKYPDVLIVDYMHLMSSGVSSKHTGKFEEHEIIAFELRDIAADIDCYGFSAGQINREGQDVMSPSPAHVAGGISVINASDWSVAIAFNEEDIDNNQFQIHDLKIRNSGRKSKPIILYRDPETLRISDSPLKGKKLTSPIKKSKPAEDIDTAQGKEKLAKALKMRG